jgi:hypothetical protein
MTNRLSGQPDIRIASGQPASQRSRGYCTSEADAHTTAMSRTVRRWFAKEILATSSCNNHLEDFLQSMSVSLLLVSFSSLINDNELYASKW